MITAIALLILTFGIIFGIVKSLPKDSVGATSGVYQAPEDETYPERDPLNPFDGTSSLSFVAGGVNDTSDTSPKLFDDH